MILRYLEGRGLRELGSLLGVSENTARMRVSRALEKLRQTFQRRGVTSTSLVLGGALAFASKSQAPTGLAGPLTGFALKMAPLSGASSATVTVAASAGWLGKGAAVFLAAGSVERGLGGWGSRRPRKNLSGPSWKKAAPARRHDRRDHGVVEPPPLPPPAADASRTAVQAQGPTARVAVAVPVSTVLADGEVGWNLGVVPALMKFDKEHLTVRAGQPVALLFQNDKCPLQHNFLLVKPGTAAAVGALADVMLTDADAMAKSYLPKSPDILAQSTRLVGLGQSDLIRFTAPAEPGDYPYLCSFPGHWRMMQGVLRVVS